MPLPPKTFARSWICESDLPLLPTTIRQPDIAVNIAKLPELVHSKTR